jgi:electron transfer flavoprotein alpha subunit
MHIVVAIKQVPELEEQRYDPATRTLVREGVASAINTYDKRSLTEAIRLRSLHSGFVTAITMGPPQAREALLECLGRGVDRAIHITDRAFAGSDTLATARTLASAFKRLRFDLILLGKFSTDSETGQVGPELAQLLDLPQVTGATAIELADERTLRVTRETDTGFEELECPLPALLTAAERLIKPVKSTPALLEEGKRRAEADPDAIEIWSAYDLGIPARQAGLEGSPTWVSDLRPVEIKRARTLLSGDALSSVETLLVDLEEMGLRNLSGRDAQNSLSYLPEPAARPRDDRSIWAVAELLPSLDPQHAGDSRPARFRRVSLELVSEAARLASQLGGEAVCVVMGSGISDAHLEELARHGAQRVLPADDPRLAVYNPETYAWVLAEAILAHKPWAVILPATSFGRDFGPRVAARLGLGLTGDCLGLEIDAEGRLLQLKPAFGGQVVAPIISRTLPAMSTLRPGVLPVMVRRNPQPPSLMHLSLEGMPPTRTRTLSITSDEEEGLALDAARLVVCVGMGIGGPEALPEVENLARRLGAWMGLAPGEIAVAGSRKVVDDGWLARNRQVGLTGRAVAPDLYVALGLQGNFNHIAGILRSRHIVAINIDPQAPIFQASDLGIVAGWRDFADALLSLI